MSHILVLAESLGSEPSPFAYGAIRFAQELAAAVEAQFSVFTVGANASEVADRLQGHGAFQLYVAKTEAVNPLAPEIARAAAEAARRAEADWVVGASSAWGKDVLPRVAALLDAAMLSDVLAFEGSGDTLLFKRPVYAGNAIETARIEGPVRVAGCRTTAFVSPDRSGGSCEVVPIPIEAAPADGRWIGLEHGGGERPDLTQARTVVTGGRPLQNAESFEKYIGGLADALGGAVGATRAVVDAGIAPNELQVGQTGKLVAPELYIAAGVSGSIQHVAGIKDSKVIVAINKDSEAPIFEIADYGLVADLFEAIPEMIGLLKSP